MYARVSTLSVPPERIKEARRWIVERAVPAASALPGRMRTTWLSDEGSGTVVAVSVYDTEANLIDNRGASDRVRENAAADVGGRVESVQEFVVIAEISAGKEDGMDQNKEVARRLYEEVLNQHRLELLDEMVKPDYIEHDPLPGQGTGLDGAKDRFRMLIEGMDPHFTIEDLIAEGDRVAVRWTNEGTNVGEFLGIPATGRTYRVPGVDIYRVEDGKLAEHWHVVDMLGHMQQLGLLPMPEGA